MDFKRMMKNSSRKAIRKARFSCVSTTAESVFGVGSTFFLLFYLFFSSKSLNEKKNNLYLQQKSNINFIRSLK